MFVRLFNSNFDPFFQILLFVGFIRNFQSFPNLTQLVNPGLAMEIRSNLCNFIADVFVSEVFELPAHNIRT